MPLRMASCLFTKKIILIGDGGVGKTSFIRRYIDGSFNRQYIATVGAEVYNLHLKINDEQYIHFQVWDTAGQEQNSGLSDGYYWDADGVIVFFDVTSRITHKHVPEWIRKAQNVNIENKNMPIMIVGNKADLSKDRKVDASRIRKGLPRGSEYTDMSAKSNYNFEKPLLYLARCFTKNPNLEFTVSINVAPAELQMDVMSMAISQNIANEVKEAKDAFLPDDDNEE
jgi:GTP-binding nuclear protein Ran